MRNDDIIDEAVSQWRRERPDLDPSPLHVVARIVRLAQLLEDAENRALRSAGGMPIAHLGDFDVLRALRSAGYPYALSASQLRRAMIISPAGLTGRLKRLEQDGWITRTTAPDDRRVVFVQLTPAGVADLDKRLAEHFQFEAELLSALTADDRQDLGRLLKKLLASLERRLSL
ncbi:MarR family transcriptional regulator [Carbonactinospora thermoautotrophica]|nr:MarR family transcriptional regulator [Carbonactinospora thermoautotrophica]KWX04861.1 hypothetical protein TH66_06085 [Carbonactinospora thermoautotrophica]KWX07927.1 hypothetical protein TR74_17110 [Carbonactinospora thermoautotrophica]MCX9193429.1 MarR family transcriptional regulator [Carbonactinospora thermoautotrophica]